MVKEMSKVDVEEPSSHLLEHVVSSVAIPDAQNVSGNALPCQTFDEVGMPFLELLVSKFDCSGQVLAVIQFKLFASSFA
jgi:hypothetical protein